MHYCLYCGYELHFPRRADAKFCNATCRKAYSRRGDSAKKAAKNIMRELQIIRLTVKKHPDLRDGLNHELKRLRDEISDILRLTDRATIDEAGEKSAFLSGYRASRE